MQTVKQSEGGWAGALARVARVAAAVGLLGWLVPVAARGQAPTPPDVMAYQGTLVNGDGNPLGAPTPKNYDVVFRIFDASSGGALVWAEQQTVTVDNGRFSVQLGLGGQIGTEPRPSLGAVFRSNTASDRYVETTVKGVGPGRSDSTMVPRTRLLPGAYAFMAKHALTADSIVNSSRGGVITIVGARVGINSTNPATALDVVGSAQAATVEVRQDARVAGAATAPEFVGGGAAPVGSVILWSGTAVDKPEGWALCDGTVVNGYRTPDLRGRFVLAAGQGAGLAERKVGETGGAESHVLAEAELPAHGHAVAAQTAMLGSAGAHNHGLHTEVGGTAGSWAYGVGGFASGNMTSMSRYWVATSQSAAHVHSFDMPATTSSPAGGGGAHPNMPPFYVLAYLVRVP